MGQRIRVKKSKSRREKRGPDKFYLCPTLEGISLTIESSPEFWRYDECRGLKYPPVELLLGNRYLLVYEELGRYRQKSRKHAGAYN